MVQLLFGIIGHSASWGTCSVQLPKWRFGNLRGAHLYFGLQAWANSGCVSTAVLRSSLSLKDAGGLTEVWLESQQTLYIQPTWDQGTCSVEWIQLAPFRTKCNPREATGAECLPACRCSLWTQRQDSPIPSTVIEFLCFLFLLVFNFFAVTAFLFNYKKECDGILLVLLWLLQWDVTVLRRRSCRMNPAFSPAGMHAFNYGHSSVGCGLNSSFYQYGPGLSMIFLCEC